MDYQSWIEGIDGLASLYAFDILPDGSYSEIRLMAVNSQNSIMLKMNPDAPEFYPGIPYRNYWMDLNFEDYVYKCAAGKQPLYSYVNARGVWLKGFYIPITDFEANNDPADASGKRTFYCLYIITYSDHVETEYMPNKPSDIANAVLEISIKLHETTDFFQAMSGTVASIKKYCGAEKSAIYVVDKSKEECIFINENGTTNRNVHNFAAEMNTTPIGVAERWERDLAMSDCLLLQDLSIIQERDPDWYNSLVKHNVRNLVFYAVRNNQSLVGFIWAANYDVAKIEEIKETLELASFLIASVIDNHQMVSRLEVKSTVDMLTQVGNRNALDDLIEKHISGELLLPKNMGIAFADLNGLKTINDKEGHAYGDRLLKRAAAILRIAFGEYEIFRAGGDEFIVLCPGITEDNLNKQISQLRALSESSSDVSFAIGSSYKTGEYDIKAAIKEADANMYEDKKEYYRNHPEMDRRTKTGRG